MIRQVLGPFWIIMDWFGTKFFFDFLTLGPPKSHLSQAPGLGFKKAPKGLQVNENCSKPSKTCFWIAFQAYRVLCVGLEITEVFKPLMLEHKTNIWEKRPSSYKMKAKKGLFVPKAHQSGWKPVNCNPKSSFLVGRSSGEVNWDIIFFWKKWRTVTHFHPQKMAQNRVFSPRSAPHHPALVESRADKGGEW